MDNIKVIKRDGTKESFNPKKIKRVVEAAGLTKAQANRLASNVTKWTREQKVKEISSLRIRDKVIEEIQKIDKYAADLYIWFQKTLDKNTT